MDGHVKVSGTWKALEKMHVRVGGAWKEVTAAYVRVGGAWKQFFANLTVAMPNESVQNLRLTPSCFARLRIDADGDYYKSDNQGVFGAAAGTWLVGGASSEVWVSRVVNSGSLNDADGIGAGRVQCSTSRIIGVTEADSIGTHDAQVTLSFFDASSGGNMLDTAVIDLSAEVA